MIGYGLGGSSRCADDRGRGVFLPRGIAPEFLGTPPLAAEHVLGQVGLLLALVGILFAVGGAASRRASPAPTTSRSSSAGSGARASGPPERARFTLSWIAMFGLAHAGRHDRV